MFASTDTHPAAQVVGHRYRLMDELGAGGMGTVYRALDRLSGQLVALKMVRADPSQLQFNSRADDTDLNLTLAREFQSLASLRHPHIISVLDYGFSDKQPYFTMELLDKPQSLLDAGEKKQVDTQIDLLVQTLQALAYLHRRGVVHRDLKPANVLVTHGQVKVLDFGVAVHDENTGGIVGTFSYMAPEVIQAMPASRVSDLYAVGIMWYELLTGQHPFTHVSLMALMEAILGEDPDFTGIEARFVPILTRLLAKEPEDRFQSANEVIEALSAAIEKQLPIETRATRESFLQAARLVERDTELAQLTQALELAFAGQGGAYLVLGESGVGKSRLLNELRTRALVKGALVLSGYAPSEGASPFQIWRDLRRLVFGTRLSDLEVGVLKQIIPDIESLLDRKVPEPPALEPNAAQSRLFATVGDLIRRQKLPIVIILEDLQWAGNESMALFAWFSNIVVLNLFEAETPVNWRVMLLGSARDDERTLVYPPDLQTLKLRRLSTEGIATLSESMLGSVGRDPELIDLLERETEGNAFFLVEVVRALAEEAGQLDQIGMTELPGQVITGGVRRLVERRWEQVPPDARPMLQIAAAAGRDLDLDDADRDGMLDGPDLDRVREISETVRGRWLYSGGIGDAGHLRALARLRQVNLAGVVTGKALYEGRFSITEGQAALDDPDA
jgi:hypothetical protein